MGAGPAWMRRGTQGHVAAPRGPAQRLRGAIYPYNYLFTLYIIKVLCPSLYGKGHTLRNRRVL